ncbi:hypothetical protein XENTR_v10001061 [Xenopus tropicalis]|nr:hypothetical protein XENTR_v10001061 [Xenopus tropicalis]
MADFETTHVFPLLHKSILAYFRYIDDLFLIWTEGEEALLTFHQYLNNLECPIKLTLNYHKDNIDFLDLNIFKDHSKLGTRLFRKPTDRNSILHASSHHPPATIRGIPYSQFLRVIRNNSSIDTAKSQLQEMLNRFLDRGYSENLLLTQLERALAHNQESLLNKTHGQKEQQIPLIFTTTFSSTSQALVKSINRNWPMVNQDETLALYQAQKPRMGYKRGRSLRDLLMKTDFKGFSNKPQNWLSSLQKLGCYKCPDCVTCRCLLTGPDFPHPHTGKRLKIHSRLGCLSTYVVYIITCPCGLYYVGKTVTTLRERISNHRSAISRALKDEESNQPVARHFLLMRHTLPTFKCMAIDQQPPLPRGGNRDLALLQRESRWIHKLDCVAPRGLNETLPLGCFI